MGDDYGVIEEAIAPTVPGCGAGDDTENIRRAMTGHLENGPGTTFGYPTGCVPRSNCNDNPVCGGKGQPICCALDLESGFGTADPDIVLHLARTAISPTEFAGPAIGTPLSPPRDTGAPLIISGVLGPGGSIGYPGLPATDFVAGVASDGPDVADGVPLSSSDRGVSVYAATFCVNTIKDGKPKPCTLAGRTWLEARLVDFDGDGVRDSGDNCPTVANYGQANANEDAEIALGKVTRGVDQLGDACDPTPTTTSTLSSAPVGGTVPCTLCVVALDGTLTCKPSTCPKELGSGLTFDSWIGNNTANATAGSGTSLPAFCPCALATGPGGGVSACGDPTGLYQCIVARDALLPGAGDYALAPYHNAGWNPMTEFDSSPHDLRYASLTSVHQQSGDRTLFAPAPTESIWDFMVDFEGFNALPPGPSGSLSDSSPFVLWSIVTSYPGPAIDPTEHTNVTNLSDSYRGTGVIDHSHDFVVAFPGLVHSFEFESLAFALWRPGGWAPFERSADEGPPFFALPTLGGVAFPISQTSDRARSVRAYFDPAVLTALADVSRGTSELLVGDDVVAGIPQDAVAIPAVVVATGTVNVSLALQVAGNEIVPKIPSPQSQTGDPVRAYDALDGRLLFLDRAAPTSLGILDVRAALLGFPSVSSVALFGDLPSDVLALSWNGVEQAVYALDAPLVGKGGKEHVLRLLVIAPISGSVRELWRTAAVEHLPMARLSTSSWDEMVLSLGIDEHSEVVTFDATGAPLRSLRTKGTLLTAAIGSDAGISLPMFERPTSDSTDLDLRVVHRADMTAGLCASHWLRQHADRTTSDPLSVALSVCPKDDDDGDDAD